MKKKVEYSHGYKVTFTYGDRDLNEILKTLILHDLNCDETWEQSSTTNKTLQGD